MSNIFTAARFAGLGLCLTFFWMPTAMAVGTAYADAVLEALAKKGLLTDQEVHDIKLDARQAARQEQKQGQRQGQG